MGQAARRATQGPGLARPGPEVVDLADPARLGGLVDEWRALAARTPGSSYFQTPDWVLGWWETSAGRPPTRLATWRAPSGRLEALVALTRDRARLHRRAPLAVPVWTNAGSGAGAADHCGWLVAPARAAAVAAWLERAIGRSALLVRGADLDWPAALLPAGARVVETTACPRVELPLGAGAAGPTAAAGAAAPTPAGPSPTFLRQLRRFTRRLERNGVRCRWEAVDEPLLAALVDLHARGRAGSSFGARELDLHRRLITRAGEDRGPAAVVARRGSEVVGVLYGLRWQDTFAAYQSGWDRRYAREALGNVLVLHALELAAARGARVFDFLRGTEPYKYRFGARDRIDRTWLVPRGVAGTLLLARHALRARRGRGS